MKRILPPILLVVALAVAACGGGGTSGEPATTGPVAITFWHSETASGQENLQKLVDRFNASQDRVRVQAVYQGNEVELAHKLILGMPTGDVPAVAYSFEIFTQTLIDSGQVVPIQRFIDRDGYDLSDFAPAVLAYYSYGGTLYAMPHGVTVPLLFYNKVPFREAGLDPEKPPRDLEEMKSVSERLLQRDGSGNVTRAGTALEIEAWYLEFELAGANQPYVDNDNGRGGPATAATFDNDAGRTVFAWWHDMVDQGLAINIGRDPTHAQGLLALGAKRAAMTLSSSGALRSVVDVLASSGIQGVDLGVAPIPGIPGAVAEGSPGVYGRGLWIMGARPQAEQEAGWTFIKWLLEPEQQAEWFAGSGYLPVRISAYDQPAAKDIIARYPLFQVPADLLPKTPATSVAIGPLLGPFLEERDIVIGAIESMVAGNASAEEAMKSAVQGADAAIADYNSRMGR